MFFFLHSNIIYCEKDSDFYEYNNAGNIEYFTSITSTMELDVIKLIYNTLINNNYNIISSIEDSIKDQKYNIAFYSQAKYKNDFTTKQKLKASQDKLNQLNYYNKIFREKYPEYSI